MTLPHFLGACAQHLMGGWPLALNISKLLPHGSNTWFCPLCSSEFVPIHLCVMLLLDQKNGSLRKTECIFSSLSIEYGTALEKRWTDVWTCPVLRVSIGMPFQQWQSLESLHKVAPILKESEFWKKTKKTVEIAWGGVSIPPTSYLIIYHGAFSFSNSALFYMS